MKKMKFILLLLVASYMVSCTPTPTPSPTVIDKTKWVYRYAPDSRYYPTYNYQDSSGLFIRGGVAKYPDSILIPSTYYFSVFEIKIPSQINLNPSQSLKLVAHINNQYGDIYNNGGGTGFDVSLGMYFGDSAVTAVWQPSLTQYATMNVGSLRFNNLTELLLNTKVYNEYSLLLTSTQLNAMANGTGGKTISHSNTGLNRLSKLNLTFRGNATVDWVKLYKGSTLIMTEEFSAAGDPDNAAWSL